MPLTYRINAYRCRSKHFLPNNIEVGLSKLTIRLEVITFRPLIPCLDEAYSQIRRTLPNQRQALTKYSRKNSGFDFAKTTPRLPDRGALSQLGKTHGRKRGSAGKLTERGFYNIRIAVNHGSAQTITYQLIDERTEVSASKCQ
jgi:hypothetical protein